MDDEGAVIAVDPGAKRIGLAISDPQRRLAVPLEVLDNRPGWMERLAEIIDEKRVTRVVVGHPRHLSGRAGPSADEARAIAEELETKLEIPVTLFDERLTTVQADRVLRDAGLDSRRRRSRVDMSAATILLEAFLESGR